MSKQLAISAAFSTFAMAAFALLGTPGTDAMALDGSAGAPNNFEAPARAELPEAPALSFFAD